MSPERIVAWEWMDRPGLDVAGIQARRDGICVVGRVVSMFENAAFRADYGLRCSPRWEVLDARVELRMAEQQKQVHLRREGARWRVNGEERPDLDDCADIDIMATPITNTLPIRRLRWDAGQARVLSMAYVRLPDLQVLRAQQCYTRLELHPAPAAQCFRYESLSSGFTAELCVDVEGLVLDYPPVWRRIAFDCAAAPGSAARAAS